MREEKKEDGVVRSRFIRFSFRVLARGEIGMLWGRSKYWFGVAMHLNLEGE